MRIRGPWEIEEFGTYIDEDGFQVQFGRDPRTRTWMRWEWLPQIGTYKKIFEGMYTEGMTLWRIRDIQEHHSGSTSLQGGKSKTNVTAWTWGHDVTEMNKSQNTGRYH